MAVFKLEKEKKERELKLIPPSDPRVLSAVAPWTDDLLKEHNFKDRKEVSDLMFKTMLRYGGIGLSANQVGLPFNMFVIGDHMQVSNGLKMTCFNPMIISTSMETVLMKEGCLTYPFLFLMLARPRKVVVKYTDEKGDLKEGNLTGQISRIFQHEYDHMIGRVFTELASKMKLEMAEKKAKKSFKVWERRTKLTKLGLGRDEKVNK